MIQKVRYIVTSAAIHFQFHLNDYHGFYCILGNVPLHSAVHGGDIRAVELCINSGAKISTQQHDLSTPVHLACAQVSDVFIVQNTSIGNNRNVTFSI